MSCAEFRDPELWVYVFDHAECEYAHAVPRFVTPMCLLHGGCMWGGGAASMWCFEILLALTIIVLASAWHAILIDFRAFLCLAEGAASVCCRAQSGVMSGL